MDLLKDWWVDWEMDWPFIKYTGKANGFSSGYADTIQAFFADLAATAPDSRKKYYEMELYDLLFLMVQKRDLPSIRRLFSLCPGWDGNGAIEGLTPLGQALDNRDIPCMRLLLEQGGDPELYEQTLTLLESAAYDDYGMEYYRLLAEFGAVFTAKALLTLASLDDTNSIRYLLRSAVPETGTRSGLLEAALGNADVYVFPDEKLPDALNLLHTLQSEM